LPARPELVRSARSSSSRTTRQSGPTSPVFAGRSAIWPARCKRPTRAVKLKPNDIEAITLRGELTRSQYGLAAALPWFDRALELDEDNLSARLEKAATLGDMGRMKEMLAETRRVLEIAPNQPMAYYLQAMLAARARKFDLARSLYQKTGGALDTQPAGMLLASAIEFQTGAVEQAVTRLERLVALQPRTARPAACSPPPTGSAAMSGRRSRRCSRSRTARTLTAIRFRCSPRLTRSRAIGNARRSCLPALPSRNGPRKRPCSPRR
jgi:predicted Zn-dependent protease